MRLSQFEQDSIRKAVYDKDPSAKIYLFGSRVDDMKRGGDIDLLIFSQTLTKIDGLAIRRRICDAIGEQKIDLVFAKDTSAPFVRIALAEGVLL